MTDLLYWFEDFKQISFEQWVMISKYYWFRNLCTPDYKVCDLFSLGVFV